MNRMKLVLVAFGVGVALMLGACEDDTYGTACAMDSDCKTGVHCWCEPGQRNEVGECPGETGTCLSPEDFAAARDRAAAAGQ